MEMVESGWGVFFFVSVRGVDLLVARSSERKGSCNTYGPQGINPVGVLNDLVDDGFVYGGLANFFAFLFGGVAHVIDHKGDFLGVDFGASFSHQPFGEVDVNPLLAKIFVIIDVMKYSGDFGFVE